MVQRMLRRIEQIAAAESDQAARRAELQQAPGVYNFDEKWATPKRDALIDSILSERRA